MLKNCGMGAGKDSAHNERRFARRTLLKRYGLKPCMKAHLQTCRMIGGHFASPARIWIIVSGSGKNRYAGCGIEGVQQPCRHLPHNPPQSTSPQVCDRHRFEPLRHDRGAGAEARHRIARPDDGNLRGLDVCCCTAGRNRALLSGMRPFFRA